MGLLITDYKPYYDEIQYERKVIVYVDNMEETCGIVPKTIKYNRYVQQYFAKCAYIKDYLETGDCDCILINMFLEGTIEEVKRLRREGFTKPIILILNDRSEIKMAKEAGADRYIVRPFSGDQLLEIFEDLIGYVIKPEEEYKIADLYLNTKTKIVKRDGKIIPLTKKEYRLLLFLFKNCGKIAKRYAIQVDYLNYNAPTKTSTIDVAISRLRKKVDEGFSVKLIHTYGNIGFVLSDRGLDY